METLFIGAVFRLFLVSVNRVPAFLSSRVEISSPINSLQRAREALFLEEYGQSPYKGSAFHSPPLLLPLLKPFLQHDYLSLFPFLLADLFTYWILQKLQTHLSHKPGYLGNSYWLNPLSILTCIGCSLSTFENLFVVLAISAAFENRPALSAFSLMFASYIGLHPALFLIPMAMLVYQQRNLRNCFVYLLTSCITIAWLSFLSSAYLAKYEDHESHSLFPSWSDFMTSNKVFSFVEINKAQHWMLETYGFQLRVGDLTPNMGLYWYFFTEFFPFYRVFFLFIFHSLCFVFLLPLCWRFPNEPLLVMLIQSIIHSMLKPYPTLGDYSLNWILMMMVIPTVVDWWWFLLMSGCLLMVLEPVMWYEWVNNESANSNFYYSITLLISMFHISLMSVILLHHHHHHYKTDKQLKSKHE